jgi:electron transport complex protein RnfD
MIDGMQPAPNLPAPPRRAVFLRERIDWMLLALAPGTALHAWAHGDWVLHTIGGALVWAFLLVPPKRTHNGKLAAPWHRLSNGVLMGALAVLWLPPALPWWTFAIAIVATVTLVRAFDGRPGASPFQPAMAGCAIALVFAPHVAVQPAGDTMLLWTAAAYAGGGIVLIAARCIRWQAPLAVFAGAAIVSFPWPIVGGSAPTHEVLLAILPSFVLTAFFIATDPSSGCMLPRARWLFGAGIGMLSMVAILAFRDTAQASLGMAGAALLMNAAAPWLDRVSERQRPMPKQADPTHP